MDVVMAVLKDLYRFAVVYRFGFKAVSVSENAPTTSTSESVALRTVVEKEPLDPSSVITQPTPRLLREPVTPPLIADATEQLVGTIGYISQRSADLYALPTRTFDGVIRRLQYGTTLQILNRQSSWFQVLVDDINGWVLVDEVTENSTDLYPQFMEGEKYDAQNSETIKLRTFIDDTFHANDLAIPLQSVEYVTYKLERKGRRITWGDARPRLAGSWQQLLRGVIGIYMGVNPKTGAVMEYTTSENLGHIAYVESVFPDGGIAVSEVGYQQEGVFGERTISKAEWREYRPIFIECS